MDAIESLFARKTQEAQVILNESRKDKPTPVEPIPFEVNKVLNNIRQETERRARLSKRKPKLSAAAEHEREDREDRGDEE